MNQNSILPDKESPARLLLRLPICDKEISTEQSHDFTLPDYLPEIRKMLRVTVSILPPETYISAAGVEYSGNLCYHALYTGADGALWSADLPAEYTFSAPIEVSDNCDLSMGVDAWADSTPEILVTRVLSPRKLNVRCRMRSKARAYGWHSLEEQLSGSPRGKIERLTGLTDSAVVLRGTERGIELSDELIIDANVSDSLRVISGEGHVFVSEAISDKDRVNLRGEVILKLLTVRDSAPDAENAENTAAPAPTVTQRKIPFSASVELEGADRYCEARGFGTVSRLAFTTEDGRIITDAELTLTVECQKNHRFAFTRDMFSTGAECEAVYGEKELPFALRTANGNFTLSDSAMLDGSGITASDQILDITGDLTADAVSEAQGKLTFGGEAHFHILTRNAENNEYGFGEITLPFRYVTEGAGDVNRSLPALTDKDVYFEPVTIRVRSDGEKLAVDAEVSVAFRTSGVTPIRILTAARFGEEIPKSRGKIVLYYPTATDTLWDAARKYHVSPDALAAQNSMEASADSSLKSTKYLVVQE